MAASHEARCEKLSQVFQHRQELFFEPASRWLLETQDFQKLCYCIVVASSPENFLFLLKFKFRLWIPPTKGLVFLRSFRKGWLSGRKLLSIGETLGLTPSAALKLKRKEASQERALAYKGQ